MTLLDILLSVSGFEMNEDKIDPEKFLQAMIVSFHGDNEPLTQAMML